MQTIFQWIVVALFLTTMGASTGAHHPMATAMKTDRWQATLMETRHRRLLWVLRRSRKVREKG